MYIYIYIFFSFIYIYIVYTMKTELNSKYSKFENTFNIYMMYEHNIKSNICIYIYITITI